MFWFMNFLIREVFKCSLRFCSQAVIWMSLMRHLPHLNLSTPVFLITSFTHYLDWYIHTYIYMFCIYVYVCMYQSKINISQLLRQVTTLESDNYFRLIHTYTHIQMYVCVCIYILAIVIVFESWKWDWDIWLFVIYLINAWDSPLTKSIIKPDQRLDLWGTSQIVSVL